MQELYFVTRCTSSHVCRRCVGGPYNSAIEFSEIFHMVDIGIPYTILRHLSDTLIGPFSTESHDVIETNTLTGCARPGISRFSWLGLVNVAETLICDEMDGNLDE